MPICSRSPGYRSSTADEIGQENDYTYHEDAEKQADSRYLHRGRFLWEQAEKRREAGTVQERLFHGIGRLEEIRMSQEVFDAGADVWTLDTWDDSVLGLVRTNGREKLVALFNFSESAKTAWINEDDGSYTDLISGKHREAKGVELPGYGMYWLLRDA